ncbi:LOG family protein [Chlamydiifrater phoenicopteri]|uniref:LOG family protein n=1 Tax=Chlamydiifrater phoenicopteri TaxID=2681469 RepID=UPI001BCEA299|nr:LOG family protein [Chlamydiifrater phoenicopteri]
MTKFLYSGNDAISPDGYLVSPPKFLQGNSYSSHVRIENIPENFLGYSLPKESLSMNLKSCLAQLGIEASAENISLDRNTNSAEISVLFTAYGPIASAALSLLQPGTFVAKLFAADDRRLVRNEDYLQRILHAEDRNGLPLLRLGTTFSHEKPDWQIIDGRLVAFIPLIPGVTTYEKTIYGFLPFLAKALTKDNIPTRKFLALYQTHVLADAKLQPDNILLVKTLPLHIRTMFARVVQELLPKGFRHTAANILQPDTTASGDIYEFYGESNEVINKVPLEFFTIEPAKEHSFFYYRDTLQKKLENFNNLISIFDTYPDAYGQRKRKATFICKGSELYSLSSSDWILGRQDSMSPNFLKEMPLDTAEEYLKNQPCYPFLQAIESGKITSQGVLITEYFPSTLLKGMLLSYYVRTQLKQIYFRNPSQSQGQYFSDRDRAMLLDLYTFGISVFWVDETTKTILKYVKRKGKEAGMFLPPEREQEFLDATFFGVYGSNMIVGNFESEITSLMNSLLEIKKTILHPLLSKTRPLAMVTGGGPGAMESGNRVARTLNILSCANIMDFETSGNTAGAQPTNMFIDAKMTYRLGELIERQDHFHLDFPIFLMGGVGTDFEMALEVVSLKTGRKQPSPVILFGSPEYWERKLSSIYAVNLDSGTIKGSEWISNCLFCVQTARQALDVYEKFFQGILPIGPNYPAYPKGFVIVN